MSNHGILDPQVNGYGGIDFQQDGLTANHLRIAARAWRRDGGGRFFLTLITDAWPRLVARLGHLHGLLASNPDLGDIIAGWHVEGPFLSDQPGFHGAHDPALMLDPTPGRLRELREAVADDPLLLTLAPERRGAIDAIASARERGMIVSLGHTDASSAQLREALAAGATGFTHLGNACPQLLDRHDNIVWRVLDLPDLIVGLIADSIHVSPPLFRLIHRILPPDRIYYTTDAMAAAGAPPGDYPLGRLRLRVGPDRVVRLPGHTNFAGSALQPGEILERAGAMLGRSPAALWPGVSGNPERWLNAGLPS